MMLFYDYWYADTFVSSLSLRVLAEVLLQAFSDIIRKFDFVSITLHFIIILLQSLVYSLSLRVLDKALSHNLNDITSKFHFR